MSRRTALILATALTLLASAYVNLFLGRGERPVARNPLSTIPASLPGWEGTSAHILSPPVVEKLGLDEYIMRGYARDRQNVLLYIGYYRSQREGAVPHSPRHCYPGSGFNPIRNEVIPIPVRYKEVREIRPNLYVFAKGGEREIVIYWYQSRGRVVAGEYAEKLYLILDAILRNRSDGALVRASLRTTAGMEEESVRMLAAFVSDIYPEIPKVIPD